MKLPSDSPQAQSSGIPTWIFFKWIGLLKFFFKGQWLYVHWLNQFDDQEQSAQRRRQRAPSWLRDSSARWRKILQHENPMDVASHEPEVEERLEPPTKTSHYRHIDESLAPSPRDAQRSMLDSGFYTESPDDPHQTQFYLGPMGDDRPPRVSLDEAYAESVAQSNTVPPLEVAHAQQSTHLQGKVDRPLLILIGCLMTIGLLMVYSSSIVKAGLPRDGVPGNPEHFFQLQLIFMGIGITLMLIVSMIPYQVWGMLSIVLLMIGVIGLGLVFSPLGKTVNGAHRWINIGINIQPIEFVKFSWILVLSLWFGDRTQDMNRPHIFWYPLIGGSVIIVLLGMQPDFGSMIIVFFIFLMTFLIAGGSFARLWVPMMIFLGGGGVIMANKFAHVVRRIKDYIGMFSESEVEYNLRQALMSFSSGRFTGVGLGRSSQKEYFLPEAHTDFILAIFGAEYGFIGVLILIMLYIALLMRCLYIARRAFDLFGALVVTMISVMFSVQAFINMSMAIGLLPTKGLTLPFISYGGSSLLITCFSMGLVLNVSRAQPPTERGLKLMYIAHFFNPFPWLFAIFKRRKRQSQR